jgi:hypothetical protein
MDLEDFCRTAKRALPQPALSADKELARDIQGRLARLGVLDPYIDGKFGPVSTWALGAFAERVKINFRFELSPELAAVLRSADAEAFPLLAGDGLAGKVVAAMQRRGYWIARAPGTVNIVYIEGLDIDGTPNDDAPNVFNDVRMVIKVGAGGVPQIEGAWEATTEPGRFYTEHPLDPGGAARIAFGQHKAWSVGFHRNDHEALIQTDDVAFLRDLDKNYQREGDRLITGMIGLNQHWGYDLPKGDIGRASAGCLVGRTPQGHREFMKIVKADARYEASRGYRFMTTVLPAAALAETEFDPTSPH